MDISQTNDNELQKAIDDIAKNETAPVDTGAAATELENKIQDQMGVPPMPPMPPMPETSVAPAPAAPVSAPEPAPAPETPVAPAEASAHAEEPAPVTEPAAEPEISPESKLPPVSPDTNVESVKTDMMRDLFPLMDKVEMTPERKWEIYKQMIEETHDNSMVGAAYEAVKGISDEKERAEALLYLINLA